MVIGCSTDGSSILVRGWRASTILYLTTHPAPLSTSSPRIRHERRGREPVMHFRRVHRSLLTTVQLAAARTTGEPSNPRSQLGHEHPHQRGRTTAGAIGPFRQCLGRQRQSCRLSASCSSQRGSRAPCSCARLQCERGQGLLEEEYVNPRQLTSLRKGICGSIEAYILIKCELC